MIQARHPSSRGAGRIFWPALLVLLLAGSALADPRGIIVTWDPNPPADQVTGYRVHIRSGGSPGLYSWVYSSGTVTGMVLRFIGAADSTNAAWLHLPRATLPWAATNYPPQITLAATAYTQTIWETPSVTRTNIVGEPGAPGTITNVVTIPGSTNGLVLESVFSDEVSISNSLYMPSQSQGLQVFKDGAVSPMLGFAPLPEIFRIDYQGELGTNWTPVLYVERAPAFGSKIAWTVDPEVDEEGFFRMVPIQGLTPLGP